MFAWLGACGTKLPRASKGFSRGSSDKKGLAGLVGSAQDSQDSQDSLFKEKGASVKMPLYHLLALLEEELAQWRQQQRERHR